MSDTPILAAGGLVFRSDPDGAFRVLVVHRPRYDDWSLPKGKADPGETPELTAVREVEEETGVRADVIGPLAEVEYVVSSGRRKVVRYFAMRHRSADPFSPNDEVDEIRWLDPQEAASLVSYDHDRALMNSDLDRLLSLGTVWLIRHGAAGDRSSWTDDDRLRPLTKKGHKQAETIAAALADHDIDAVYSSPYVRCRETVRPLADRIGRTVEDTEHLAEGANPAQTVEWFQQMEGQQIVACSHGDVIPAVIRRLGELGVPLYSPTGVLDVKKGSIWTLALEGPRIMSASYTAPPSV